MKPSIRNLRFTPRNPKLDRKSMLAIAVLALVPLMSAPAGAQTLEESSHSISPAMLQALGESRADYRQQQWQRLARNNDRDSLIAAVLIGMPTEIGQQPIEGQADVERHLASAYGHDPLALFALALSCQMQKAPCAHPEADEALLRIEPENAVDWLLLPQGAAPDDARLHAAAFAPLADTHLRDITRIVRTALAGQPTPAEHTGVDPNDLALLLRRDAVCNVPLPVLGGAVRMCKTAVGGRRSDCIELGRRLEQDRSGTILSRMVGSAMLRRLLKGTPEEAAAKQLRREYVWMSEQMVASATSWEERLQSETAAYGEWEAWQRAVERLGSTRTPPPDWIPKNPQTLLLDEERAPAASR